MLFCFTLLAEPEEVVSLVDSANISACVSAQRPSPSSCLPQGTAHGGLRAADRAGLAG